MQQLVEALLSEKKVKKSILFTDHDSISFQTLIKRHLNYKYDILTVVFF